MHLRSTASTAFLTTALTLALSTVAPLGVTSAHAAFTFDDITYWVGSGANRSALVIDWHDGKDAVAYGYRWDGAATGEDMITAIADADPRLVVYRGDTDPANTAGDGTGGPNSIYGIGLDRDGDGFTLTPGSSDTGSPADPDDSYAEGWFTNYWGYFVNIDNNEYLFGPPPNFEMSPNPDFGTLTGEPYNGGSWGFSGLGFIDHVLFDGSWDGWGFNGNAPGEPIAVPEPASAAFLVVLGALVWTRRRR